MGHNTYNLNEDFDVHLHSGFDLEQLIFVSRVIKNNVKD